MYLERNIDFDLGEVIEGVKSSLYLSLGNIYFLRDEWEYFMSINVYWRCIKQWCVYYSTVTDRKLTAKLCSGVQKLLPPSDLDYALFKTKSNFCQLRVTNVTWDLIIRFYFLSLLSLITDDKDIVSRIQLWQNRWLS